MSREPVVYLLPLLTGTTTGRVAAAGAALQLPFVLFLVANAYIRFPDDTSTAFAGLALLHSAAAASALACWFYYGVVLRAMKSKFLYVLIIFVAIAPLFVTVATLRDG